MRLLKPMVLAVGAMLAVHACAPAAPPAADTAADEAALKAATRTWLEAYNAGDVERAHSRHVRSWRGGRRRHRSAAARERDSRQSHCDGRWTELHLQEGACTTIPIGIAPGGSRFSSEFRLQSSKFKTWNHLGRL